MCRLFLVGVMISAAAFADTPTSAQIWADYQKIIASAATEQKQALNAQERAHVLQMAASNPVTSLDVVEKYDPTGGIGFCFGRSFSTETYARLLGLRSGSIRKLFIVGDMRSNPGVPEWRFHVATVVKGDDGDYWALDPISPGPRPMLAKDWINWVRATWDTWHGEAQGKSFLYLATADGMIPDIREFPKGIIDLEFNQIDAGLAKAPYISQLFEDDKIYVLNQRETERYFLHTSARATSQAATFFDFNEITISGMHISYSGYFADFVKSLALPLPAYRKEAPVLEYAIQPLMAVSKHAAPAKPLGFAPARLLEKGNN